MSVNKPKLKQCFRRGFAVSDGTRKVISDNFPGVAFQFEGFDRHPHPVSATERSLMERKAIENIHKYVGKVVIHDIGGSAARHRLEKRDIHCVNPILDGNDVVRRIRDVGSFCRHDVLTCTCPVPDVFLSVHSLYYFNQDQVLQLVNRAKKGLLFAVVHIFDEMYGQLHFDGVEYESKYQYYVTDGQLRITMSVKGNLNPYDHPDNTWMKGSYYSNGSYAMAWGGHKQADTWILEFTKAPIGLRNNTSREMSLVDSLNRNDHYGSVRGIVSLDDKEALKPTLDACGLYKKTLRSVGTFFWIESENRRDYILVPKDIIIDVAVKMAGVERNKESFKRCINLMRTSVSNHKLSIPSTMKLDCVTYGAAMAFVYSLKQEIVAYNQVATWRMKKTYTNLTNVLGLQGLWEVNRHWAIGCATFGVGVVALVGLTKPTRGLVTPAVLVGVLTAGLYYFTATPPDVPGGYTNVTVEAYLAARESLPSEPFKGSEAFPDGLPGTDSTRELTPLREDASIDYASQENQLDRGQFYVVAPCFQECLPIVPYSSLNNEVIAVTNRVCMQTPVAVPRCWENYDPVYKMLAISVNNHLSLLPEEEAFTAWNSRFKPTRREAQAAAFEALQTEGLNRADFYRKAFVKRELTLTGEEPTDFDPRCIQGVSNIANVALGPYMLQFSKALAKVWHANSKIYYTSGATAEDVGHWRAQFGEEDVTIFEVDHSRFDAHQGKEVYDREKFVYQQCGIGEYSHALQAFEAQKQTKGFTSHGVKYSVPYGRKSGDPNTTCGNTMVNGVTIAASLSQLGVTRYNIVVMGDDSLIVVKEILTVAQCEEFSKILRERFNDLGFKIKLKYASNWAKVEYCSSLFWPVHTKGELDYVLGPKLGRRMPKLGFSLNKLSPGEVKGMILGLKLEAGYLPFIGLYCRWVLRKLTEVKMVSYIDERNLYKALPAENHQLSPETVDFFCERYHLSFTIATRSFKEWLDNLKSLDEVASWPPLLDLLEKDL